MPELTEEQRQEWEEKIKNMSPEELQEFQKQQCVFCQIIHGKIPSKKVYEDDVLIGVLDINPATKGHILLLPKEHYAIMPQVPDAILAHAFLIVKYLSQVLLKSLKATGTSIFIANGPAAGQRAQHFMLHLIPRKEGDHLFPVTEKLITPELQQKVKMTVENRLSQVLGIQKKALPSSEKEKPEEEHKQEINNGIVETEKKAAPPKQKSAPRKKQLNSEKKSAEDVTLDDIASLFKS